MGVIGDSRRPDGAGPGILPLRHAKYDSQGITLDMRCCVLGIEIDERTESGPGAGFYSYTERSVGDLCGGMLWRLDMTDQGLRDLPMWRFSFPSMVTPQAFTFGAEHAPEAIRPLNNLVDLDALPMPANPDQEWMPDLRLPEKTQGDGFSFSPETEGRRWFPRFPANFVGLAMALNREEAQESVFMTTDPRLVAMNRDSDPDYGTLLYDMEADEEDVTTRTKLDIRRRAPLQGLVRVLPGPFEGPCKGNMPDFDARFFGTPALQIGHSEMKDVRGGIFFDRDAQGGDGVGGAVSATDFGGPLEVGLSGEDDLHHLLTDADGHSINSMHISLGAFYCPPGGSNRFDGPLKWEGEFKEEPASGTIWRQVKFVWRGDPEKHFHPCTGEEIEGKHIWVGACIADDGQPYEREEEEPAPSGTPMTPPGSLPPPPPPPPPLPSGLEIGPIPQGYDWNAGPLAFHEPDSGRVQIALGIQAGPTPQTVTDDDIFRDYNQIYTETAMTGILARPQFQKTGAVDLRNWTGKANPDIDPAPHQAHFKRTAPITARLEAFGKQSANAFLYTNSPAAGGRYAPTGTADGGFVFTPPEASLIQVEANTQPSTVSNSYFIFAPNTRLGWGRPDTDTGEMTSGISVEVDAANNRLKGYTEASGTRTQVFEIDQDIQTKVASKGFIVRTPDNSKSYRIRVDNSGNFASDLIS